VTLTATYESTLARIRLNATGLGSAVDTTFEHSLNNVTWTTVRCGLDSPIISGAATIYDYEFSSDVTNYYRVRTEQPISFVNVGTAAHANNGSSVTPGLPVSSVAGDLLFILAAIRATAAFPNTPTGYTLLASYGNLRLFGKIHSGSEVAPTVSFTGGAATDDTSAQMSTFRNVTNAVSVSAATLLTPTTQNIPYPALTALVRRALTLWLGWRADDWTSVDTIAGAVEIGEPDTALGGDQGIVWDYKVQTGTTPVNVPAGSFMVSGGTAATATGAVLQFAPTSVTQTTSITPVIDELWIKSIGKPFLNRTVYCLAEVGDISRGERHGIFEVIGRSFPVAVTDKHQSREGMIRVITRTKTEEEELDLIIASGEPLFFHTPHNHPLPTMHVVLNTTVMKRPLRNPQCAGLSWRVFTLPWREIAAPSSSVCGATITWQGVINTYATWQAVILGETSWADLLSNIGQPGDIIVG